ncbi:hypothetical protein AGMMS4952_20290 [Spirochaetia bacterium]|nr:hypothetical protein AGMMS4952_20290 [Spirochaetia bacterium]
MKNMSLIALLVILSMASCDDTGGAAGTPDGKGGATIFKSFNRALQYGTGLPDSYRWTDYHSIAQKFHDLAFDASAAGTFLPLSWPVGGNIGMATYVGDSRAGQYAEGITLIPALISAGVNGFNTAGKLASANTFFNVSEGVITNNPGGRSADQSMWYILYPAILYTQLSLLHETDTTLRANSLTTIGRWYEAYQVMKSYFASTQTTQFEIRSYDFALNTPVLKSSSKNWREPDCAAGMAVLFYTGYKLTGDQKYLDAATYLLNWLASLDGGPLYEVLHYYTPALMAVLNDFHGGSYDITKILNQVFDGYSGARSDWGSVTGKWGSYPVNGLFGSTKDRGGYAFAMNTFAAAGALAPLVRYDTRYAQSIGKWLLHLHSNSRYFFSGEVNPSYQSLSQISGLGISPQVLDAIPYEGIIKEHKGKIPWVGGDPLINNWAATDFSLYSGAHTGILGVLFSRTDQEGILRACLISPQ